MSLYTLGFGFVIGAGLTLLAVAIAHHAARGAPHPVLVRTIMRAPWEPGMLGTEDDPFTVGLYLAATVAVVVAGLAWPFLLIGVAAWALYRRPRT